MSEQAKAEQWQAFYSEELGKPLRFVRHDTNSHEDSDLEELRDELGMEAYGRWWLLVEHLGKRRGHSYDVTRPNGWARLARDLEFKNVEGCKRFVTWLVDHDLLHRGLAEEGRIVNERLCRDAEDYAREAANGRIGAWARHQAPAEGPEGDA